MPLIILLIILLICGILPQFWVRFVMRKHGKDIADMPGTGGELAAHLVERYELAGVKVEEGLEGQDHYNPTTRCVNLSPSNYAGRSITAIAVAAHEVGHAVQFAREEPLSKLRGKYLPISVMLGKLGIYMLFAIPIVTILFKVPAAIFAFIALSLLFQLAGAAMYLIVLPEEWDASFNKALPMLREGNYLPEQMMPAAHRVLKAAALTYCAAALANVVNIGRWFMLLRR
jgi:Zn-dependent membrane protease YugP|tara:strand:+ start:87469 stop:88155 length:687 start_codon:yes stop_codon:yes gene_type:complete